MVMEIKPVGFEPPEKCVVLHPTDPRKLCLIYWGEQGYRAMTPKSATLTDAEIKKHMHALNAEFGVTLKQAAVMMECSMFGTWPDTAEAFEEKTDNPYVPSDWL